MIISCVVREIPIGINPKTLDMNSNKKSTAKIKEVLVNFSCLLKIL
jgi:trehalose-6-phosphate synthase